jgi:2-keto-3-deoxy-L-rhamnonate aldolase RhmA
MSMLTTSDLFNSPAGTPRIVRGAAIYSCSARLAELAIRVGFDTVWIEMEHAATDFTQAEAMCHAVEAAGGFGTIRVVDGQRSNVLRALETGARIIVVPMVDTPEQARSVVDFGKFAPLGQRGFNTRSRGLDYGLMPLAEMFQQANARTHLFVQIETKQAVENVGEICRVAGLSGILIGPGDLSLSLGMPGDFKNPELINTITGCIHTARSAGLHAGVAVGQGPLLDAALQAGADLAYCISDVATLIEPWRQIIASLPRAGGAS